MTTQPVLVPLAPSPPDLSSPEDMPSTPNLSRPRSDTTLTTSSASSSSSPHLQTPQTPSILGMLDPQTRHRADSYGFGEFGKALFQDGIVDRRLSDPTSTTSLEEEETAVEGMLHVADPSPASPPVTRQSVIDVAPVPSFSLLTSSPLATDDMPSAAANEETIVGSTESVPDKGKTKARSAVRAKLQRSKSSLKEVFRIKPSASAGPSVINPANASDETELGDGRRRPRLRSLLSFSGSRASSSASIRTVNTLNSASSGVRHTVAPRRLDTPVVELDAGVVARDFGSPTLVPLESASTPSSQVTPAHEATDLDRAEPLTIKATRTRRRVRPMPSSAVSTGRELQYTSPPPPMTRSATVPILAEGTFGRARSPVWQEQPKRDLFTAMLPRELKVMVLQTIVDMSAGQERQARWDGIVGARRELIRLSRVSKAWQALCFDGQLWPTVDLAPYVSVLHPRTLGRILEHARPFVKVLSLRGMDALKGSELVKALAATTTANDARSGALCNLTTLDLRGCKKLDSGSLLALIAATPNLRIVNLKGVQGVSSEVMRSLARSATLLESLDVSRCWDISLCDLCVFVKMLPPDQARRLKVLRAGGMKAYGTTAADFMPLVLDRLVNLEVLDLLGCTHIFDKDVIRAAELLEAQSRRSNLLHLNLSGCVCLTPAIFPSMRDVFSNLQRLELASMPEMFDENGEGEKGFHNFLRSLTKLEKLDLDGTGSNAGVNDKMLEVLTPPKGEKNAMTELRIGYAKGVTPEGMIRFIRGCTTLRYFEADNTSATNAVMREFYRRHAKDASISLVDCRAITPVSYSHLSSSSRPRDGFSGYEAIPMGYDESELDDRVVVKVFWSWRRVGVAKGWRETLREKEREIAESRAGSGSGSGAAGANTPTGRGCRGKGWWKNDETFDDRAGCVVQ